ncbi:PREDICTED: uncharacterized protein LOC107071375 [Polistes dominula]|uniref:Uncharacterized protein LOC107071375 n=1 Tax=Polistes dominula TaxID=743375 RepID=A0ABM1J033_POLDO|nr:PREDICTED: uncharacterized protein LOC107071375 [Polistes dominula]
MLKSTRRIFHFDRSTSRLTDLRGKASRIHAGIRPTPTAHHSKAKVFILKDLNTCTHVWLRCDHVKAPLEVPYQGPYKVIDRISDKLYKILVEGEEKNVSIERLKPCYINKTDLDNVEDQQLVPEKMKPHHWGSLMDIPKKTYKRTMTFKLPAQSHLGGSSCSGRVSTVTPLQTAYTTIPQMIKQTNNT